MSNQVPKTNNYTDSAIRYLYLKKLKEITNQIPKNISEEAKLRRLYVYFLNSIQYDHAFMRKLMIKASQHNDTETLKTYDPIEQKSIIKKTNPNDPARVILNKTGVCGGISEAFAEACNMLNIDARTIGGKTVSRGRLENGEIDYVDHAWNIVYLKDESIGKHYDIVYDMYNKNSGKLDFFGLTNEELKRKGDHHSFNENLKYKENMTVKVEEDVFLPKKRKYRTAEDKRLIGKYNERVELIKNDLKSESDYNKYIGLYKILVSRLGVEYDYNSSDTTVKNDFNSHYTHVVGYKDEKEYRIDNIYTSYLSGKTTPLLCAEIYKDICNQLELKCEIYGIESPIGIPKKEQIKKSKIIVCSSSQDKNYYINKIFIDKEYFYIDPFRAIVFKDINRKIEANIENDVILFTEDDVPKSAYPKFELKGLTLPSRYEQGIRIIPKQVGK